MTTLLPVIGLFGTCGTSRWRTPFLTAYEQRGLRSFNPQVTNWTPECAAAENEHFRRDALLLYAVTAETTAFGSLAEVGLAVAQVNRAGEAQRGSAPQHQHLLLFVDPACADPAANERQTRDSVRVRELVRSKLPWLAGPRLQVCGSLDEMLVRSLALAAALPAFAATSARTHP